MRIAREFDRTMLGTVFALAWPTMLEQLTLSWNPQLTDLSCLLELKELRRVQVSQDMSKAIASLGEGYGFELIVE